MKPARFDFAKPPDVASALKLLGNGGQQVKLIAGGQSLGPMLNMRLVQPELVVDITGIEELRQFDARPDRLTIGACITHSDIEDQRVPDLTRGALSGVASGIAYRAVRNRGTIGGSLTHADPSADWLSMLSALGATLELRSPTAVRTVQAADYMIGALEADIHPDEMLISVSIIPLGNRARWGYYKSCRKTGEFAHAIGAYVFDPDRNWSRLVFGATESRPIVQHDAGTLLSTSPEGMSRLDVGLANELLARSGMTDVIDRKTHIEAARRAIEQGNMR